MTIPADWAVAAVPIGNATAVFTGRRGGVSSAEFSSFNLADHVGDDRLAVESNREAARNVLGLERLSWMRQVHGAGVVECGPQGMPAPPECDCLLTSEAGCGLVALAADCVPVAIAGGSNVAVVHAGWRGIAAGVLEAAVDAMRSRGESGLEAAIGPAAGACCYEVGDEALTAVGAGAVADGRMLDLAGTTEVRLRSLEVAVVDTVARCTICDPAGDFFSHRRDNGRTGRQGVIASLSG